MSRRRFQRCALIISALLLLLAGGITLWLRAQRRQYALNRALIVALDQGDNRRALALINEGADPTTPWATTPRPTLERWLRQLLHGSLSSTNGSPTAFALACGERGNEAVTSPTVLERLPDDPQLVSVMLPHIADVNGKGIDGTTPLHWAVRSGRPKTASLLIADGADVNARDDQADTPLISAVQNRTTLDAVRLLIEEGADVNAHDDNRVTPLMQAAMNDVYPSAVPLLLDHGAQVNAKDNHGQTPLMYAVWHWAAPDTVHLLLEGGAQVNATDNNGQTALNGVILHRSAPTTDAIVFHFVEQLLGHGADPNLPDNQGMTPLGVAQAMNYPDIITLLRQAGARK